MRLSVLAKYSNSSCIIINESAHTKYTKNKKNCTKVFFLDNWDDVCDEICRSNIIQRDNQKFARKLNKDLVKLAKERAVLVSIKNFDNIQKFLSCSRQKMMTIYGLREQEEK